MSGVVRDFYKTTEGYKYRIIIRKPGTIASVAVRRGPGQDINSYRSLIPGPEPRLEEGPKKKASRSGMPFK